MSEASGVESTSLPAKLLISAPLTIESMPLKSTAGAVGTNTTVNVSICPGRSSPIKKVSSPWSVTLALPTFAAVVKA